VLLVTIVAVLSGFALVATVLLTLNPARDASARVPDRIIPSDNALEETASAVAASQALFLEAIASPDQGARVTLTTEAQQESNAAQASWERFTRVHRGDAPGGLRRLMRDYNQASLDARTGGAAVFSLDPATEPAAFAAALDTQKASVARQLDDLDAIRRRYSTADLREAATTTLHAVDDTVRNVLIGFGLVMVVGLSIAFSMYRSARRDERRFRHERNEHQREARRADLEMQFQRALEMEPDEESTYAVVQEALRTVAPGVPAELLLADSSRAHFQQVTATEGDGPCCPVGSPRDCPATATGQLRLFVDSRRLDACPHLRGRSDDALWGICVPVSIAGRPTGVIHVAAPIGTTLPDEAIEELELVGRKTGDRIGAQRVLARSETQAQVDGLSGLWNRRTLDEHARELIQSDEQFCVAFADLDHFKNLNDTHGHETGDRALRLFSRVLRDSVRPNDLPARYGGEEFLVILPDCSLPDARVVAERIQQRLSESLRSGAVPPFTVSVGLAQRGPDEPFLDVVRRADDAMLRAKSEGRDRIVTSTGLSIIADADAHPAGTDRAEGGDGAPRTT
jgi:diguanylate cyclase (GGDEF)-like protein